MLKEGANKVYAVDIAIGQLDEKLINDKKVINMEGVDLRKGLILPEKVDFCSIDVTFVSSIVILKKIKDYLKNNESVVILIKPPYEVSSYKDKLKIKLLI